MRHDYQSELCRANREADQLLALCTHLVNLLGYSIRAKNKAQWELGHVISRVNGILDEHGYSTLPRQ